MKKWWMHWLSQLAISYLPGGVMAQRWLQNRLGQLKDLSKAHQFDNAIEMLMTLNQKYDCIENLNVMELGTGWIPAIPLTLTLAGAKVDTFDVQALCTNRLYAKTLETLYHRLDEIAVLTNQPLERVVERYERLATRSTLKEGLAAAGGDYHAPAETTSLECADMSYDVVLSNLVLQCVPEQLLKPILKESFRILKPQGLALHRMWLGDEYSVCDSNRDPLHFLHYKEATWQRWFNHPLKHLNRWRAKQFLELFDAIGFQADSVRQYYHEPSIMLLKRIGVDDRFQNMTWDEISVIGLEVTLQKPALMPPSDQHCAGQLQPVEKYAVEV